MTLIRATHPAHPHEGLIHAANLPTTHLTRAETDGWEIATITTLPDNLDLPDEAARLLDAVAATDLPWVITRRPTRTGDGTETIIEIRGIDPERPGRWLDWKWDTTGALGPEWMPLWRAHELLTEKETPAAPHARLATRS